MQTITKRALAKMYFPHKKKTQAVRKLRDWINTNKPLLAKLEEMGYGCGSEITPKQLEVIFYYLGEPD